MAGKFWRLKYCFNGTEKKIGLSRYPEVSLGEARKRRDMARHQVASGIDPTEAKVSEKLKAQESAAQTFKRLAEPFRVQPMRAVRNVSASIQPCWRDAISESIVAIVREILCCREGQPLPFEEAEATIRD